MTPWACAYLLTPGSSTPRTSETAEPRIHAFYSRVLGPFVGGADARKHRHRLYVGIVLAIVVAVGMVVVQWVVMKMLPFDNKSELQVMLDMPEGTPVETHRAPCSTNSPSPCSRYRR